MDADADRRGIEHELHDGVQQQLVALAVNLQLAVQLASTDPVAAKTLLEEMGRDVQQTLDETARLAQRIYPPLLEAGGLAAALRAAAVTAGVPTRIEIPARAHYPVELAGTLYWCCCRVLERADAGTRATFSAREEAGGVAFEIVASGTLLAAGSDAGLERLRDRVEALGGRVTIESEPDRHVRLSGSLPIT